MEELESKVDLGGRPYKFQDPVELRQRLEDYFNKTPPKKWTITGLALSLECDRDTLLNYETNKNGQKDKVPEEVIRLIKKAKLFVHNSYELSLRDKGRSGDIFALKNFGWVDKQEIDHTNPHTVVNMPKVEINGKEMDFKIG